MKSAKEIALEKKVLEIVDGKAARAAEILFKDMEVKYLHDYANTVSIRRLNFNDHGPVHMRKVALNSIRVFNILDESGIKFNLEKEEIGTSEDSKVAVLLASMLHDIGMSVGRENHEKMSILLGVPVIDRILDSLYKDDFEKRIIIKSMAIEGIAGHMATQRIHSLEAGLIMIADGCDMEKGRSRIPMMINNEPKVGDIHQYSSASVEKVLIGKGEERPLNITVRMTASVGFFQVEEVLFPKINASPAKPYIELYAGVKGRDLKRYL